MKTTLNKIRAFSPCTDGWEKLLKYLGKTKPDDEPLSLLTVLESNGLDDALWCFRAVNGYDKEKRLFTVWCARQVQHLMTDQRSLDALDVAERYANGLATDEELRAASDAASDAASAAASDAAWAAAWAAWAAARAAARAAGDAAWAAGDAARAAARAAASDAASDAASAAARAAAWAAGDAARAAARDAASAAASDAAWAARDAARAAARKAQEKKLREILTEIGE